MPKFTRHSFLLLAATLLPSLVFAANPLNFEVPPTDISINFLANIFGIVDGVLYGSGSQIMGVMFSVFNGAVLSLGAIIIMYTLIISTLNTAHEGEFLGKKWSSIWIPVRSAAGIALLLPKASGYCLIQIMLMWVVVQGVGAADSIWSAALNYLQRGGVIIQQPITASEESGNFERMVRKTKPILQSSICMYGLQEALQLKRENDLARGYEDPGPVPNLASTIDIYSNYDADSPVVQFPGDLSLYAGYEKFTGACGTVSWKNISRAQAKSLQDAIGLDQGGFDQLRQSRAIAVGQMIVGLAGTAQTIVRNRFNTDAANQLPLGMLDGEDWVGDITDPAMPPLLTGTELQDATQSYYSIMRPTLRALDDSFRSQKTNFEFVSEAKAKGWLMAGSYYFDLSNVNTLAEDILEEDNTVVTPQGPAGISNNPTFEGLLAADKTTLNDLVTGAQTTKYLNDAASYKLGYGTQSEYSIDLGLDSQVSTSGDEYFRLGGCILKNDLRIAGWTAIEAKKTCFPTPGGFKFPITANALFAPIRTGINNFFEGLFTKMLGDILLSQKENMNPIVALAQFGKTMVASVMGIWFGGAIGAFILLLLMGWATAYNPIAPAMSTMLMWLLPLLSVMLTILLTEGAMIGYYLPLIPLIIFVFGGLAWLIAVIESMVAAPLVAIGIAHPEGSDVFGKSDPALMLILNVFLRPSMMIFGFIGGIILSYVGIWLLNEGFRHGVAGMFGITGTAGAWNTPVLGFMAVVVIYGLMAIMIIQKAFALIHIIPDKVLRWLQGNFQESLGGDIARSMEADVQKGFRDQAGSVGKAAGEGVSSGMKAFDQAASQGKKKGGLSAKPKGGSKKGGDDDGGGGKKGKGTSIKGGGDTQMDQGSATGKGKKK